MVVAYAVWSALRLGSGRPLGETLAPRPASLPQACTRSLLGVVPSPPAAVHLSTWVVCLDQCFACTVGFTTMSESQSGQPALPLDQSRASAASGNAPAVPPHATGAAFWDAAVKLCEKLQAQQPQPAASSAGSAPAAPRTLCQVLALKSQEDALDSLLFTLRETPGAGRPTALTQELAGMTGSTANLSMRAICLRLGVFPSPKAKRAGLVEAITTAVQQHAEKHPGRAMAALKGTALFEPPRLFYASLPPAVASAPVSAVQSQAEDEDEEDLEEESEEEQPLRRSTRDRSSKGARAVPSSSASESGSAVTRLAPRAMQALLDVPVASAASSRAPARSRRSVPPTLSLHAAVAKERSLEQQFSRRVSHAPSDYESAAEESEYEVPAAVFRSRARSPARDRASRARSASPAVATLEEQLVSVGISESLAPTLLRNILQGREQATVEQVLSSRSFQSQRNSKEVLTLARLVDCLRRGHADAALELALRRISGVLLGDKTDKWSFCDFLMQDSSATAYLPHSVLQRAMAYTTSTAALTSGGSSSSSHTRRSQTSSRSSGRTGDRRGGQRSRSPSAPRNGRGNGGRKDGPAKDTDKAPAGKPAGGARH
jgi:hypothetical protein